jgi:hypothetical protein
VQFEAFLHVNAVLWRVVYRELRVLTNDKKLALNPMDLNDLYEEVWNVEALLQTEESLTIMEDGVRPWPRVKEGPEAS